MGRGRRPSSKASDLDEPQNKRRPIPIDETQHGRRPIPIDETPMKPIGVDPGTILPPIQIPDYNDFTPQYSADPNRPQGMHATQLGNKSYKPSRINDFATLGFLTAGTAGAFLAAPEILSAGPLFGRLGRMTKLKMH